MYCTSVCKVLWVVYQKCEKKMSNIPREFKNERGCKTYSGKDTFQQFPWSLAPRLATRCLSRGEGGSGCRTGGGGGREGGTKAGRPSRGACRQAALATSFVMIHHGLRAPCNSRTRTIGPTFWRHPNSPVIILCFIEKLYRAAKLGLFCKISRFLAGKRKALANLLGPWIFLNAFYGTKSWCSQLRPASETIMGMTLIWEIMRST